MDTEPKNILEKFLQPKRTVLDIAGDLTNTMLKEESTLKRLQINVIKLKEKQQTFLKTTLVKRPNWPKEMPKEFIAEVLKQENILEEEILTKRRTLHLEAYAKTEELLALKLNPTRAETLEVAFAIRLQQLAPNALTEELQTFAIAFKKVREHHINKTETDATPMTTIEKEEDPILLRLKNMEQKIKQLEKEKTILSKSRNIETNARKVKHVKEVKGKKPRAHNSNIESNSKKTKPYNSSRK